MLNPEMLAIAFPIIFISAAVQGISGSGFAILSVPFLALMIAPKTLVPLILVHSLFLGGAILVKSWRHAQIWRAWPLFLGGVVGTPVGVYLLKALDSDVLKVWMGAVVILFAIALLISGGWKLSREKTVLIPVGILSGILNGSIAMSGPPVILFLANQEVDKIHFRASITLFFFAQNIITLPVYAMNGLVTWEMLKLSMIFFPAMAVGTAVGMALHNRVKEDFFRKMVLTVVVVAGIVSIVTGAKLL